MRFNWPIYVMILFAVLMVLLVIKVLTDCGMSNYILYGDRILLAWLTGYCS